MSSHRCGLVVGKFCPLHRGHELVIRRALAECAEVVLISYTKPEFPRCDPAARESWLETLFPGVTRLVIDDDRLAAHCERRGIVARSLPHNDAGDTAHREFVAWLCSEVMEVSVDAVYTSESYGPGFAAHLAQSFGRPVSHVSVDSARLAVPVSGTAIRAEPASHRQWLAPEVFADLMPRICILGGESTGKSTLTSELASALGGQPVAEYGRELWELKGGELTYADMHAIALEEVRRERQAAATSSVIVCDTSPLTTVFYSKAMFGMVDPQLLDLAARRYDHIFLCAPDFAFVQDGTRRNEQFRMRQHLWYQAELGARRWPYGFLTGTREERLRHALGLLSAISKG